MNNLPNGWEIKKVGNICQSIVPARNKPKIFDGDIAWVTIPEIKNCKYIPSKYQEHYISENEIKKIGGKIVPKGAVVMTAVGDLGMISITTKKITLNQQLHAFVCSDIVLNEYLAYFLATKKHFMESRASKTTILYMNKKCCESIPILLPPLPEQTKIAQILSTWDNAINTAEKLLSNSEQQKKALMQQLLTGKKRLKDKNGVEFCEEWEEFKLGDIAKITTGNSNREDSTAENGQYTFFDRSEDIRTSNRYLFDGKAVIVAGEGQDFIPKHFEGKFDLHQRTYAIMEFKQTDSKFVYYYIHYYRYYFLAQAVGSTVKSLRLPMFQKMPIKLPPLEEQQAIAQVLTTADQQIDNLKQQITKLKAEKKALMQQLLIGKIRVKT